MEEGMDRRKFLKVSSIGALWVAVGINQLPAFADDRLSDENLTKVSEYEKKTSLAEWLLSTNKNVLTENLVSCAEQELE